MKTQKISSNQCFKTSLRLLFIVIICFAPFLVKAQHWMSQFGHLGNYYQIKAATEDYFSEDTSRIHNKSCGYKDFNRWMVFMESRADRDGSLKTYSASVRQSQQQISLRETSENIPAIWQSVGPSQNTHNTHAWLGLITSIYVDTSNFTTIYAGSNSGGLFVTHNGGDTWRCLTDNYFVTGIESIEINPGQPGVIYIATGINTWGRNYGGSVLKSTNYGETWTETTLNSSTYPFNYIVSKTIQHPTNPDTLIALVNFEYRNGSKILKTTDGGANWQEKYSITKGVNAELVDVDMHPTNPDIIFAGGRKYLQTTNCGEAWQDITTRLIDTNAYRIERIATAFHPTKPDTLMVILQAYRFSDSTDIKAIKLSVNGGLTFTDLTISDTASNNYYVTKMEIEWSKVLEDVFYIGGLYIHRFKLLPGNIVSQITIPGQNVYHADIREMKTYRKKNDNTWGVPYKNLLYQGNDGGITKGTETNSSVDWFDISRDSLNITQFYGLGIPNDGSDLLLGGTQDGNFNYYNTGTWYQNKADAAEAVFNFRDSDTAYIVEFGGTVYLSIMTNTGGDVVYSPENTNNRRDDAPLEMSSTNPKVLYIGGINVWKTTNGLDFSRISDFQDPWKLKTIREAPSAPNIIYAAKENRTWNLEQNKNRLYKTVNGDISNGNWLNIDWVDITPNTQEFNLVDKGIFDLAVNPNNPHTFFIALDGCDPGHRIYKCEMVNGVYNWSNYSQGLLNLPVNCLEIYKGNDLEEMFAGTDDGVYYRNINMQEWQPFGTGLPLTIVSDIEIDYVNNEIVVSTFGRGIYKASLCQLQAQTGDIIVNGNETWSGLKRIPGNITVNPGAILTINGTVRMNSLKEIIVKKGGQLIIDGGKISNQCRAELWQGIRVNGTISGPQNLIYQGYVKLMNGAIVENAKIGILSNNNVVNSGGGIVIAANSTFRNNVTAVQFDKYTYKSSISTFNLCTFVTDEGLFEGYEPKQFVRLNEISGITFNGCIFTNKKDWSDFNYDNKGIGIYSNNSFFAVDHKCTGAQTPCNEYTRSEFSKLQYGIYASSILGTKSFSVKNSFFYWNDCGIYAGGVGNMEVKHNEFDITSIGNKLTGLYMDNCNGYIIEENRFKYYLENTAVFNNRGIVVNNSGELDNTIYKNRFRGLGYGIVAQNQNRGKDGKTGLLIKCNDFNIVRNDVSVLKDNSVLYNGIAKSQGSDDPEDCKKPAGNRFSQLTANDYWSIWNDCEPIDYYHHIASSNDSLRPSKTTNTKVFETELDFAEETCCPPNATGGGGTGTIDGTTSLYKSEAESTSQALSALIDEGNTAEKVMDVNLASPTEALTVRDDLLQTSPYVSDTVLKTAINREELLNNAMIRDVMVANPHSAKSETLMQELDMRLDPMPDYMKDEILEGVFVLSAKELMEAKRDMSERLYNYGFNRLLSASLTDTLITPVDTVMALLAADGSAVSLMKQAWLLLETGDTTAALNQMQSIGNVISLSESELTELGQQQVFMQWLVENEGIDSVNIEPLNNFMLYSSPVVSSSARGLLMANNLLEYNEPYLEPDFTKSVEVRKPRVKQVQPEIAYLKVYPNPAHDFITTDYNTGDEKATGLIEIIDESGRRAHMRNLTRQFDQIILDTRYLKPGHYIIKLVLNGKSVCSTKFVISR